MGPLVLEHVLETFQLFGARAANFDKLGLWTGIDKSSCWAQAKKSGSFYLEAVSCFI